MATPPSSPAFRYLPSPRLGAAGAAAASFGAFSAAAASFGATSAAAGFEASAGEWPPSSCAGARESSSSGRRRPYERGGDLPPLRRPVRIPRDPALEAAQHYADLALLLRIATGFLLLVGMAWGSA